MNELNIVVNQEIGGISTNFEEIKESLKSQMVIYNQMEVTEENKVERKKDIATLRNIQKAIDAKRKEVKSACLQPYEKFEAASKELIGIVSEPIELIDKQVKEFEEKARIAKVELCKKIYSEEFTAYTDKISFESIFNSKWTNVATTEKSIRADIQEVFLEIDNGAKSIIEMNSDVEEKALLLFFTTRNLAQATKVVFDYEMQKKEIEARLERERIAKEKAEAERLEREKAEAERLEAERIEKEKAEAETVTEEVEEVELFEEEPFCSDEFAEVEEIEPFREEEFNFVPRKTIQIAVQVSDSEYSLLVEFLKNNEIGWGMK